MRALAALLLVAGCTPSPADEADARGVDARGAEARPGALSADSLSGTFEGYFSTGFEHTGFRPCADTTEAWWTEPARETVGDVVLIDSAADVGARYQQVAGPDDGRFVEGPVVWTRLRGRATPLARRAHGHIEQYDRTFAVDSVLAMRAEGPPGACARPASVRP